MIVFEKRDKTDKRNFEIKINGKEYVGITNNITKRWDNEKSYPKDPNKRQVIQEAIHKYGSENFDF